MNSFRRIYFFAVFAIFCLSGNLFAQVPTVKQDSVIDSLTESYTEKLALTGKQEVIFKQKLQQYFLDKEQLRQEMRGKDKLRALYELGLQENGEMGNVLTAEQLNLYLRLKPSLQPLEELDVRMKN